MKRLAALAALRLSLFLKSRAQDSVFEKYKRILDSEVTEELLLQAENMAFSKYDDKTLIIRKAMNICGFKGIARTCVELAVLLYMEKSASEVLELACGGGLTVETAAMLTYQCSDVFDYVPEMLEAYNKIELLLSAKRQSSDFIHDALYADARLISFLNGIDEIDALLKSGCNKEAPSDVKPLAFEAELDKMKQRLEFLMMISEPRIIVQISGEKSSGRYFAARYAAQECGLLLLSVEFDFLVSAEKPIETIRKLMREVMLDDACLCIRNVHKSSETEVVLKRVFEEYGRFNGKPLFILTEKNVKLIPFYEAQYVTLEIPKCSPTQSMSLWNGFVEKYCYDVSVNTEELASKMCLTAGQIERIVKALIVSDGVGETDSGEIFKLCYKILDDGRYDNIKRVESGYTIDDLKMDEKNKRLLLDICNQVEYRQKVYGDWGMARKYAYGRCVSALFAGPPGTGKTMAVHVLSSILGLELFKVDLSQLVDKYIGETEKRLEEVFSRAEKSNMILFFDEADSVMGKRSEVNDSKDKYANTEISFILQRMEEYDGIVILATNYLQNIDTAFMRRIRYVVNFAIPDEKIRKEIWISSFADNVPLDDEIDFDFLARKFELAGGNIKNIVLNATFNAAAENMPVEMKHILKAVHRENTKDKRVSFIEDYEHYAYLLE